MDNRIIDLAFAFDYWVFGGYVRDVILRRSEEFGDIDIGVPESKTKTVDNFLAILGSVYPIEVTRDSKVTQWKYGTMSPLLYAVVRVTVNGSLKLDLCLFSGEMSEWREEHSVDLSCNLFYTSRDTPLGLRYIPKKYRYEAAPVRTILSMTMNGIFEVVYDPVSAYSDAPDSKSKAECKKVRQVVRRAEAMTKKGWVVKGPLVTPKMMEWVYNLGPLYEAMINTMVTRIENKQKDSQAEATGLPTNIKEEVRRKLDL
jgi:hypothetical protein